MSEPAPTDMILVDLDDDEVLIRARQQNKLMQMRYRVEAMRTEFSKACNARIKKLDAAIQGLSSAINTGRETQDAQVDFEALNESFEMPELEPPKAPLAVVESTGKGRSTKGRGRRSGA